MADGKRWTVYDRDGNPIYLTEERWLHITEVTGHPELADYEDELKKTIQKGRRQQEPLNPRKYRYAHQFDDLPEEFNYIIAVVVFGLDVDAQGMTTPNNWIATAFMKNIHSKGDKK
jgi:hypothetical protein